MAKKERWASRLGLVLAMAGNAVGLGNFLRFPAQAAKNGGGAFLIPYIVALVIMGLPLIWVEWSMGRYGGQHGHHSSPGIFQTMGRHPIWKYLGVFGLWTNLIIAAYYLYIESWTLAYSGYSLIGGASFMEPKEFFDKLTGETPGAMFAVSPWGLAIFLLCMAINVFILSRGLAKGIELVCKVGMPLLIVFGALLAIRGLLIVPGNSEAGATSFWADPAATTSPFVGLNFVWNPKFDSLANPSVWLAAAGQIFFTLSIGMGSIHCYASYLRETDDVALTGATAAWTNEFCEVILGGSILLPIAVAYLGMDTVTNQTAGGSGFDLGFIVFPTLFQKWGWLAPVAGFMWFGLLFFAAITSSLAMGQPIMSFLQAEFRMSRPGSALAFGAMLLPLAIPVACVRQAAFFDEFDHWAGTFSLVVFALIEIVLFAWVFGMDRAWAELSKGAEIKVPRIFYPVMKYVTPIFLILILIGSFCQPKAGWETYVGAMFGKSEKGVPAWEWAPSSIIGMLTHADVRSKQDGMKEKLAGIKAKAADGKATDAELKEIDKLEKEIPVFDRLPFWRNIDRLVMIATFAGFSLLVAIAWRRRAAGTHHHAHS